MKAFRNKFFLSLCLFHLAICIDWNSINDLETILKNYKDELKKTNDILDEISRQIETLQHGYEDYFDDEPLVSVENLYEAGTTEAKDEHWNEAYDYFISAWKLYGELEPTGTSENVQQEIDILDQLQYAAYKIDNLDSAIEICNRILSLTDKKNDKELYGNLLEFYEDLQDEKRRKKVEMFMEEHKESYSLCLEQDSRRESLSSEYICRYNNRNRDPIFIISPLKEEIVNFEPFVVIFHDLITDSEISIIETNTKDKFIDSKVISLSNPNIVNVSANIF